MLFNSYVFILGFLPIVWLVARILAARSSHSVYLWWLAASSIVFYAWQSSAFGALFLTSIVVNYVLALLLLQTAGRLRTACLVTGIAINVAFIGYFKYLGFTANVLNDVIGLDWHPPALMLPLGISFYTFQQIGYLVDCYRGLIREHRFQDYVLFVTFFPQLVAGPIVSQNDIVPQFHKGRTLRFHELDMAVGITLFGMGLFKKVVLADQFSLFANPVFATAETGTPPPTIVAWLGMLSYTLQLYFDFSGYSDMAIGLGRMFGIRLPINFNSPYKAVDIVDFWRRWHLTLSSFLRDYIYIPLGGSRGSVLAQPRNLMITMLLGGLWHGAGWTFVAWGAVHGILLSINHAWNKWQGKDSPVSLWRSTGCRLLTFLVIALTWVLFRAESFSGALHVYQSLFLIAYGPLDHSLWHQVRDAGYWVPIGLAIVWALPNSQEFLGRFAPAFRYRFRPAGRGLSPVWWQWSPTPWHAFVTAGAVVMSFCCFSRVSSFIYFNF